MSHLLALGLLGVDCLVRAWRIQLAVWTAGRRLSFSDAFRLNLYGEAASQLTPNRLGGEPARFLGPAGPARVPSDVLRLARPPACAPGGAASFGRRRARGGLPERVRRGFRCAPGDDAAMVAVLHRDLAHRARGVRSRAIGGLPRR